MIPPPAPPPGWCPSRLPRSTAREPSGWPEPHTGLVPGQRQDWVTPAHEAFGGGPRMPLLPGTWGADSASPADPGDGNDNG